MVLNITRRRRNTDSQADASGHHRILIVDDVHLLRNIARNYFTSSEFQLTTARSGAEALRVALAIQPHLIIMDAEMPDTDGINGCKQIKSHPALFTIPVILVSEDKPEKVEACWQSGCEAVLPRPLSRRELLAVARQMLTLADRAAPRVEHPILVRYGETAELGWHDYARNIGNGGLYLDTERELSRGQELHVEFLVPGAAEPTRCRTRVAWINVGGGMPRPDLPPGAGIEFVDLDTSTRRSLQGFVLDATRMRPIAARNPSPD